MNTPTQYGLCPCCKYAINFVADSSTTNEIKPHAGLISICSKCGEICVTTANLTLVKMSDKQKEEVKKHAPDQYSKMLRISAHFQRRFANTEPTLFATPQTFSKN